MFLTERLVFFTSKIPKQTLLDWMNKVIGSEIVKL